MKTFVSAAAVVALAGVALANNGNDYSYDGPAVAIPDSPGGPASVSVNVADSYVIGDINIGVRIDHTWQGDLIFTLSHGASSAVIMHRAGDSTGAGLGFSADNFGNATTGEMFWLDDDAAAYYDSPAGIGGIADPGIANVTGSWRSYGAGAVTETLSSFLGDNSAGTWTLSVSDNAGADTGSIVGFTVQLKAVPAPASAALLGLGGLAAIRRRR